MPNPATLEDCRAAGHNVAQGLVPWVGTVCLTCQPFYAAPCGICYVPRYSCCC